MMNWGEHATSVVSLPKTGNLNLIMRRYQVKDSVQNNWPIYFNGARIMKDKSQGTKTEWKRWSAIEDPGLDPDPEKEHEQKTKQHLAKFK